MKIRHFLPRLAGALVALVALPLLGACTAGAGSDGRPQVVAAFYPLEYVVQRIAGDRVHITSLAQPGAEPHDLELTLKQTAAVAGSDLVVYEKGFQPAVDAAVKENAEGKVVDAAAVAHLVPFAEEGHHDEHDGSADHSHEGQLDPHFWLDPNRLADVAVAVAGQLERVDPAHAGVYERNLVGLKRDLDRLDAEYQQGLAHCRRDTIVVSHDAFGYLGVRYGLGIESINGISPDAEPSPAHLRRLADLIEHDGITTVFTETLASPDLADTLANGLGLKTAVLDPIEGLSDATANQNYLSLMRANLAALREANGCS